MMPLYSVLAAGGFKYLPIIVLAAFGAAALIAIIIGCVKGVRRVSWFGVVWLLAGAAFVFLQRKLGAILQGKLSPVLSKLPLRAGATDFVFSFALAAGCILVVLLLNGIFSLIFRPKIKWRRKKSDRYDMDFDGVEYDEEYEDYDDYEQYESRDELVSKGYGTPSFFGRVFGGLFCAVNVLTIMAVFFGIFLMLVGETPYKNDALSVLFTYKIGSINLSAWALVFAQRYAFDFLLFGILLLIAYVGRKKGFLETIRTLIVKVGAVVGVIACFYLPFSKFASAPAEGGTAFVYGLVGRCALAMEAFFGTTKIASIVGMIVAGLILTAFLVVVLLIVNFLLKKLVGVVKKVGFFRVIDGSLSALAYLIVGVLICVLIWTFFTVLSYYGIFDFAALFAKGSTVSDALLRACEAYIAPALENLQTKISGLFAA